MRVLLFFIVLTAARASAQHTSTVVINTTETQFATLDRAGDLYLVKNTGTIEKYTLQGKRMAHYSDSIPPTLFDTGNGVRLLSYYRPSQKYTVLNPFLSVISDNTLETSWAIDPWLICSSSDYNLWIMDAADWSLKRVDTRSDKLLAESSIDTSLVNGPPAFTYMREYQNFLFVLEAKTGVLVFNNFGKHLRTLPAKDVNSFSFLGEEIYFISEGNIVLTDLFTLETRKIELNDPTSFVLLTGERKVVVTPSTIQISAFQP